MRWRPKSYRNNKGGLLAGNFLRRLDRGLLIDRNAKCSDKKARKKIAAPAALKKMIKKAS